MLPRTSILIGRVRICVPAKRLERTFCHNAFCFHLYLVSSCCSKNKIIELIFNYPSFLFGLLYDSIIRTLAIFPLFCLVCRDLYSFHRE